MKLFTLKLLSLLFGLLMVASGQAAILYWDGDGSGTVGGGAGTWDTTLTRWSTTPGGSTYQAWVNVNEDSATFPGPAGAVTVAVGTGVVVNKMNITAGTYTFSGSTDPAITFSGAGAGVDVVTGTNVIISCRYGGALLNKTGAGRLTLNNASSTVSKYNVTAGHISTAAISRFGTAPGALVSDFLRFDNGGWGIDTGNQDLGATRGITVDAGGAKFGATTATLIITIPGPITGTGGITNGGIALTHTAGCILQLNNTGNNYAGVTALLGSGAVTRLGASGVIPDTSVVVLSTSGVQFQLNGFDETVKSVAGTAGTIACGVNTLTLDNPAGETYSSVFTGTAGAKIVKNGGGVLSLTGSSTTWTGEWILNNGTIGVGGANIFGSAAGATLTFNGGKLANTSGTGRTLSANLAVNIPVDITVDDSLFTSSANGQIQFAGPTTLKNGNRIINVDSPNNQAANLGFSGAIGEDAAGRGIIKIGTGNLALNGINTYSGDTTVSNGTVSVDADGTFGNGAGTVTLAGGNLRVAADRGVSANNIPNPINIISNAQWLSAGTTGTRNLVFGGVPTAAVGTTLTLHEDGTGAGLAIFNVRFTNAFTFNQPITFTNDNAGHTINIDVWNTGASDQIYNGVISGAGSIKRSATTAGTGGRVTFTAQNTYTNGTSLNEGEIALGSDCTGAADAPTAGPLGTGAVTIANDGGKLSASGGARNLFNHIVCASGGRHLTFLGANDLELSGNIDLGTLSIGITNNNAGVVTLSGFIGNGSDLDKYGPGTLVLSGANGYSGVTTVNGGTLVVNNITGSGTGSSAVAVRSGGTLKGNGTILGVVNVNSGGTLAPGTSIGTLTLGTAPVLVGTTVMEINRNGGSPLADKLVVSPGGGTLPYGGTLTVVNVGAAVQVGDTFDLFDADAFSGSFTTFNLPSLPAGLGWDTSNLLVNGTISVTVLTPPSISGQPTNQAACDGSVAVFSVTAAGGSCAANYSWSKHNNVGWGSSWSATGGGGTFRSTSTGDNFGDPACTSLSSANDINSPSGNALGIYGGGSGDEIVTRSFTALTAGQVISIDFDNGNIDSGKTNGFSLQTAAGADLLQFYFVGGGANYKYNDGAEVDTGIGFQRTGLRIQVILGAGNTYTLKVTPCGGTASYFGGTYAAGSIGKLKLFNQNTSGGSDYDIYFNNFIVGGYVDNADNYSGGGAWDGQDKGDQPIIAGNGGSTYTTPTLTPADNGSQYQVVVSSCGGTVVSSPATLTINPQPTITLASSSTTVCAGSTSATLAYTATSGSPNIYFLDFDAAAEAAGFVDGSVALPASPITITVPGTAPAATYNAVLVVVTANNCISTNSPITVVVSPSPTITLSGPATTCAGSTSASLAYSATTGSPDKYNIDFDAAAEGAGFVDVSLATLPASPIIITVPGTAPAATYNAILTVNAGGCFSTNSAITVVLSPQPTITLSGPAATCAGSTSAMLAYSATTESPDKYNIDFDAAAEAAGFVDVSLATLSASPIIITVPGTAPATTYNAILTVKNASGCFSSNSAISVVVNPLPTVTLSGPATTCAGSTSATLAYSGTTGSPDKYNIDFDGAAEAAGFVDVSLATLPASPIIVTVPGAAPAATYNAILTVRNAGGCFSTNSAITVVVKPQPTITLSGPAATCAGSTSASLAYSATTESPDKYNIDFDAAAEAAGFVDVTLATLPASPITITVPGTAPAATYNAILTVRNANGCFSTNSAISVVVNPLPTITLSGPATTCAGSTSAMLAYGATTESPDKYNIDFDAAAEAAGFVDVSLATLSASPIVITVPGTAPAATYNAILTVRNANGCFSTNSAISVIVNPLPTITLSVSAATCAGSTSASLAYSATTESPDKYNIDFDAAAEAAGFVDVSLATLPASPITITVPGTAPAATYNAILTVRNANGCFSTNSAISVIVNPLPTITLSGPATTCAGSTSAMLAYGATTESPDKYNIDFDAAAEAAGFVDVSLATLSASPIVITVPGAAPAATYNAILTVRNANGCFSTNSAISIVLNARPTSVVSGNSTNCVGDSSLISAALTGTGPWDVYWSDGVTQTAVASSPATRIVGPSSTTVYTVTNLTDANCTAQAGDRTGSATVTLNFVTANPAAYLRAAGFQVQISIADLLTNVSNTVGQPITFLGVGTDGFNLTTTNGITLTTNATLITYPASAANVNDSFTYKIATSQGCTNYGTVSINIALNPGGLVQSINVSGGTVTLNLSGVPSFQYVVERADNVLFTVNATNLSTNVAPGNGLFSITDSSPPQPTAFYRLRYSP